MMYDQKLSLEDEIESSIAGGITHSPSIVSPSVSSDSSETSSNSSIHNAGYSQRNFSKNLLKYKQFHKNERF